MIEGAIYWDASAVLSSLLPGRDTREANVNAGRHAAHIVSSLTCAEVWAVLARMERERVLAGAIVATAYEEFEMGRWHYVPTAPPRNLLLELGARWSLKSAGLWHLALAKTLREDHSRLTLLSFDPRLAAAAQGEGLSTEL